MITENDLREAIKECEGQRNPTSNTCIKLAAFYIIRDHLYPPEGEPVPQVSYSYASEPGYESDTEFGQMVKGLSLSEIMPIMDELMTALSVINPRLYRGVLRKFEN